MDTDREPLIRRIKPEDDAAVAAIIRGVMPEFGADGPGFAIHDAEVGAMFDAYNNPGCVYFLVEEGGRVVGGAGVAPLAGGDGKTCELRKMYFLPDLRGRGIGKIMLRRCLEAARELGYSACYLETLTGMDAAMHLYEQAGFKPLAGPKGCTGHYTCDRWYALDLTSPASPPPS